MKPLQISQDILSLANFKSQASRVLKQMKESNRPVVITLNGSPAAVLVPPAEFDKLSERQRFLDAVESGLNDLKEGRVFSDEQVKAELEAEFGSLED